MSVNLVIKFCKYKSSDRFPQNPGNYTGSVLKDS